MIAKTYRLEFNHFLFRFCQINYCKVRKLALQTVLLGK